MARKSIGKSMTTGSRTASTESDQPADQEAHETQEEVSGEAEAVESAAPPAPSPAPRGPSLPPEIHATKWAGSPMWNCKKCGMDTFDEKEAMKHKCNGREVRYFEGDPK